MKKNRKKRREVRAGRKRKSSTVGKAAAPKRSGKQKTKLTTLNSKRLVQLSSSGKSSLKAPKSGRKPPKNSPDSKQKRSIPAVEYLAGHWATMPRPEKTRNLQSLIDNGWKIRVLARALKVVSESRIRQLLKLSEPIESKEGRSDITVTAPHVHGAGEGNSRAKDQTSSMPVVSLSSGTPPTTVSKEQVRRVTVPLPATDIKGRGKPEAEEIKHSSPEAATREESRAEGGVAKPAAPDYAIEDPEVGGKLVASWIRSNFKRPDWSNVIADYTTAYWLSRPNLQKEVEPASNFPAGLRPLDVIRYCLSDAINAVREGSFFQEANRKWFVCWASLLLPDSAIRRKAMEIAEEILNRPTSRWSYLTYDPKMNPPTPCVRSQGTPLADFLEGLAKYVNFTSLLQDGGPQEAEVKEALRYASATLREGSPPPLD